MRLDVFVLLLFCSAAVPTYGLIVIAHGSVATERVSDIFLRCDATGLISDDELVRVTWSYFDQSYNSIVEIFQADLTSDQPAYLFSSKWAGRGQFQPSSFASIRLPYRYVTRDYAGDYRCEVESLMSRGFADVPVDVLYGPGTSIIITPGGRVEKKEREGLILACSAQCSPQCTYRWYKAGRRISNVPMLSMTSVSRDDAGLYACQARNDVGRSIKPVDVRVRFPASVLSLNVSGQDDKAVQGRRRFEEATFSGTADLVVFTCQVRGWPEPTIIWFKSDFTNSNDQDINSAITTHVDLEIRKSLLEIKNPSCKDNGIYSCKTWNGLGLSSIKSVVLNVSCPPYETNHSSICQNGRDIQMTKMFQDNVQFHICFFGNPIPSVVIRHNDDVNSRAVPHTGAITCEENLQHCDAAFTFNISTPGQYGTYEAKITNPKGYFEKMYHVISQQEPLVPSTFYADNISHFSSCFSWIGNFNGGARQTYSLKLYPHDPVTGERELGQQILVKLFEEDEGQNKDGNYSSKYYTCQHGLKASTNYTAILTSSNRFGTSKYPKTITFSTLALATVEVNTSSLDSFETTSPEVMSTEKTNTLPMPSLTYSPSSSTSFTYSNVNDYDYEKSTSSFIAPILSTSLSSFFKLETDDEDDDRGEYDDEEGKEEDSFDVDDVDMDNFFQLFDAFFGIHHVDITTKKSSQDHPVMSNYSYHAHLKSLLQKYVHPVDRAPLSKTELITPVRINSETLGITKSVEATSTTTSVTDLATSTGFVASVTFPAVTVGVTCVVAAIFLLCCVVFFKKRRHRKAANQRYQQRLTSTEAAETRQIPPPIYCTPLPAPPCSAPVLNSQRNSVHSAGNTNERKPSVMYTHKERTSAPNLPAPVPSDIQISRSKLKPNSSSPPETQSPNKLSQPNHTIPVITVDNKRLSCPSYLDLYDRAMSRVDPDHADDGLPCNPPSTNFGDFLKPPSRNSSYTSINQTSLKHPSDDETSMTMSYLDLYEALSSRTRSRSPSNIYDPLQFESTHEPSCVLSNWLQTQLCKQVSASNEEDEETYYPTYLESVPLKPLVKGDPGTPLQFQQEHPDMAEKRSAKKETPLLLRPKANQKPLVSKTESAEVVPYEIVDLHLQKHSAKSVADKSKSQKFNKKRIAARETPKDKGKKHTKPDGKVTFRDSSNPINLFAAHRNPFLIYLPTKADEHFYDTRIPLEGVLRDGPQKPSHEVHDEPDYVEIDTNTPRHTDQGTSKFTQSTHPNSDGKELKSLGANHRTIGHLPQGSNTHEQQDSNTKRQSKDSISNVYEVDGYVQEDTISSLKRDSAASSWSCTSSSTYNNELHLRHSGATARKGTNSVSSKTSSGVSSMCAGEDKRCGSYTKVTFDLVLDSDINVIGPVKRDSDVDRPVTPINHEKMGDDTEEHIYAELPDIYDEIKSTD